MKIKNLIISIFMLTLVCGFAQATILSDLISSFTGPVNINASTSNTALTIIGNNESFVQLLVKNTNNRGSADVMVGNDLSDNVSSYMNDMGVTGSNFSDPNYINVTPANTSYELITNSSFIIGTGTLGKTINFFVDSFTVPSWVFNITNTGIIMSSGKNITGVNNIIASTETITTSNISKVVGLNNLTMLNSTGGSYCVKINSSNNGVVVSAGSC